MGLDMIEFNVPGRTRGPIDGSYDNCPVLVHTGEGLSGITEGRTPGVRGAGESLGHKGGRSANVCHGMAAVGMTGARFAPVWKHFR